MNENTSTAETGASGAENLSHEGEGAGPGYSVAQFLSDSQSGQLPATPSEDGDIEDNDQSVTDGIPKDEQDRPEGDLPDEDVAETEEPAQSQGKRTLQQIQQHRQQQKLNRKYDGLDEEETKLFKQMSQAAYDRLYPAYLASKEGEKKLKELEETNKTLESRRWYEEENAWEISPEYRSTQENINFLDFEENYWTEQLAKIEKGEEYNPLAGKPGEYREGPAQPATVEAKVDVLRKLQTIGGYKQQLASKLDGIKTQFAGKHKSFNEGLKSVDSHLFGKLDVSQPHLAPQYKSWLERFPKEFQGQLPYQMLAKAAIVIEGLAKALRGQEATAGLKKAPANASQSVGPGNGKASGGNIAKDSVKSWDNTFASLTGKRFS